MSFPFADFIDTADEIEFTGVAEFSARDQAFVAYVADMVSVFGPYVVSPFDGYVEDAE